ncbi:MAG: LamG-like jellyroll fold domain-containing protein [Bacilli bacterium]
MNKQKSFTLIELLVVIVIIGILAGVIMISTSSSIDKANIAKSKVFSESVKNNLLLNLVSEWKLDDGSGTSIKDDWGENNGTLSIDSMWKQEDYCISKKCVEINAAKYALIDSNTLNFNDNFTIEFWINLKDVLNWRKIILKDGSSSKGWLVGLQNGSYLFFAYSENGAYGSSFAGSSAGYRSSSFTFKINNYYHVVISNRNNFYINGEKITTTTGGLSSWATPGGNNIYVGYTDGASIYGIIDEIKLYDAALPSSQIKQNYIVGLDSLLNNGSISKKDYNQKINELAYEK